jgi:hypothetical protein
MEEHVSLVVNRTSIGDAELRRAAMSPLGDGQVRLRIDHVAITANTITYAQFGDLLGYWGFFPADEPWGLVPAIGSATVEQSHVPGVDEGTRLHGWYPMATTVDIVAAATATGLRDDGPHRAGHAPVYRAFSASDRDPLATDPADDERHSLLRGLYATGHLIESFLDHRWPGVTQSVVMSASSKTAIGYAFAARRTRTTTGVGPRLVGVTSEGNRAFVDGLDLYDDVITYAEVPGLEHVPTVIVDMAGAGAAVAAAHRALGDLIVHSMIVGKSHHDAPPAAVAGGPQPELFFAPSEVERQIAEAGAGAYTQRLAAGLAAFIDHSRGWLEVERRTGPDAFADAWRQVHAGAVPPSVGVIASMT